VIQSVIARLEAAASPPLARVLGVMDLAAVAKGARPTVATAYVYMGGEEANPDQRRFGGGPLQTITHEIVVVLVVRNVAGTGAAKGAAAGADLELCKGAIKAAMHGFVPTGAEQGPNYAGGDLIEAIDGAATYELRWITTSLMGGS